MKKILLLLIALIGVLVMVGCGETDFTGKPIVPPYDLPATANYDGSAVTIKFWHRMGNTGTNNVDHYITEFNKIYPNITVIQEKPAADYDNLANAIALAIPAGGEPHISESYPDHIARYAQAEAPLPLNSFISNPNIGLSASEIADFLPGLWKEGLSYDNYGSFMSMPFTKSSEALFYNKTFFDLHGFSVPETWEELFALCAQIKALPGWDNKTMIPFQYDSDDNLFITASEQWGAPYTGFDEDGNGAVLFKNDESKKMVKYFHDKVQLGYMGTRRLTGDYGSTFMKQDKMVMAVGSTGGTQYNIPDDNHYEVGIAPLPHFQGKEARQIQQGPNLNLFKKNNVQEMIASWLFVKFMLLPENTALFAINSGYIPVRDSAFETTTYTDWASAITTSKPTTAAQAKDKLIKEAFEMFRNTGDRLFTSVVFALSSKCRSVAGTLLYEILSSDLTGADLDQYIDNKYTEHYLYVLS